MNRAAGKICAIALLVVAACQANSVTIWYGGDWDFRSWLESARNTSIGDARVYDNFEITGPGYSIDWVFGNFAISGALPSQLYYEFRSGVGPGNGGTLLRSGTVGASVIPTGRAGFGLQEYFVRGDFSRLNLPTGEYWFSVAPIGNGSGHYYLTTTDGTNGTGQPRADGNSFYDSISLGANFDPTTVWLGAGTWDFSHGFGNTIPEPATMLATLTGLAALALRKRRNR